VASRRLKGLAASQGVRVDGKLHRRCDRNIGMWLSLSVYLVGVSPGMPLKATAGVKAGLMLPARVRDRYERNGQHSLIQWREFVRRSVLTSGWQARQTVFAGRR
jgi:hypothetical protein